MATDMSAQLAVSILRLEYNSLLLYRKYRGSWIVQNVDSLCLTSRYCSRCSSALMMEAQDSVETFLPIYQSTRLILQHTVTDY